MTPKHSFPLRKLISRTALMHVIITLVLNWGALSVGEIFHVYEAREINFWRTVALTFPLILFLFLAFSWILLSVAHEWKIHFYAHLLILVGGFCLMTIILNKFALLPVEVEFRRDFGFSGLLINGYLLMKAYFQAYQPLNFFLAVATAIYWTIFFWGGFAPEEEDVLVDGEEAAEGYDQAQDWDGSDSDLWGD